MSALPRKIGSYQVEERLEGHDREVYVAVRPAEKANRRYVLAFFDLADDAVEDFEAEVIPVSYTHLTLLTIYSV